MKAKTESGTGAATLLFVMILLSLSIVACSFVPAWADDRQEAEQLVDKARLSLETFVGDTNMGAFPDLLKKAKGVFIVPQLLKGAFIVGASGGSGVLLVRDEKTGGWNGPAFSTIGGASFGLQIGGQASEVVLLVMTPRGISSLLSNSFKLGADIGIAAGPVGVGVSAASANLSADIISYARSKGLYGGISLDGAVVATREDWNDAYYRRNVTDPGYARKVTPTDILIRHNVTNPQALGLREVVERNARPEPTRAPWLTELINGGGVLFAGKADYIITGWKKRRLRLQERSLHV
jgi:SH3 domain-containing YSC84-like protein 1